MKSGERLKGEHLKGEHITRRIDQFCIDENTKHIKKHKHTTLRYSKEEMTKKLKHTTRSITFIENEHIKNMLSILQSTALEHIEAQVYTIVSHNLYTGIIDRITQISSQERFGGSPFPSSSNIIEETTKGYILDLSLSASPTLGKSV